MVSCNTHEENDMAPRFSDADFNRFPYCQYMDLYLGMDNPDSIISISNPDLIYKGESFHYQYPSSRVIFPNASKLTELKVFLAGENYLTKEKEFFQYLSQSAIKIEGVHPFIQMEFQTDSLHYSMSYFLQKEYIRLHFVLLESHS